MSTVNGPIASDFSSSSNLVKFWYHSKKVHYFSHYPGKFYNSEKCTACLEDNLMKVSIVMVAHTKAYTVR